MSMSCIFSIGYGLRSMEEFIKLLKEHNINYLVDVRSMPYSKTNPKFNQKDLTYYLKDWGITYVFMGDLLGGRPEDKTCYTPEGKVDYSIVQSKPFYRRGIERLKTAHRKGLRIAMMCSESNPAHCHRSKLIGMTLISNLEEKVCVQHIDESGKIKDQAVVMNEVFKGRSPVDLFNESIYTTSRKSYLK